MKTFLKNISLSFTLIVSIVLIVFALKGRPGNPNEPLINTPLWRENGPFELSPERGRFGLTYSLLENHSFHFTLPLAEFTVPDAAFNHGNYVSLFPPALSIFIMPGYLIGRALNLSQVGSFAVISVFGLLNLLLIRSLVVTFTKNRLAGTLAGFLFLFATPAFPYAVSLYQHHVTTFFILLSTYILVQSESVLAIGIVLFLCALSIPLDSPNVVFLFPLGLFATTRLVKWEVLKEKVILKIRYLGFFAFIVALIPIGLLLGFNKLSNDNPFKLSGTLSSVNAIDHNGNPVQKNQTTISTLSLDEKAKTKSAAAFFKTRNLLNGFYVHLVSPDRGVLFYAPFILFGIVGFFLFPKKYKQIHVVMVSTIGAVFLLYSLWGDPWGGWAFGDRYMIPAYALLCVYVGVALPRLRKNLLLSLLFAVLCFFSIAVNTLGAITTNRNPPQGDAQALELISGSTERFSFDRNWFYLQSNGSKSFLYGSLFHSYLSPVQFYALLTGLGAVSFGSLFIYYLYLERRHT